MTATVNERRARGTKGMALAAMLLAGVSWAIAFPLVTIALTAMSPLPISAIRFVTAAVLAIGWILWQRAPFPARRHLLRYLACGFFGSACYSGFINMGQATVSAGTPILTAIIAWFALGERLNWAGWLGCLVGFAGVSYIALDQPGGLSFGAGAMFVFLASLSASIYFVLQKPLIQVYGAMPCTAYTLVFSALFLLPWFPDAVVQASQASPHVVMVVLGLILFPTLLAYVGSVYALGQLPAGVMSSVLYLTGPVATLLAFFFLGEIPSMATLIGGATAIVGTAVVARWGKAAASPAAE